MAGTNKPGSSPFSGMPGMGGPGGPGGAHGGGPGAGQPKRPYQPSGITPSSEAVGIGKGIKDGLMDFIPETLRSILGFSASDTPEEKARKQQMLQRYKQMDAEQQQYVQQKLQQEHAQKQHKEQEDQQRKKIEAQQKSQKMEMPKGKETGDRNNGSKKATVSDLNKKRQKLSDPT